MTGASYASSGVDVEAGERAVALMRASVARAQRREVVGELGGFAGLFDISAYTRFRRPLLATSTDGVGTKIAVARAMDVHDTCPDVGFAGSVDELLDQELDVVSPNALGGFLTPERVTGLRTALVCGGANNQLAEPGVGDLLAQRGVPAWACGVVRARRDGELGDAEAKGGSGGAVTLVAEHRRP